MAEILIVDDAPDIRAFIATVLTNAGHHVLEAGDGQEGLRLLDEHPIQLIITDLVMPEMDGIEMLRRVRKLTPPVPVIAVSGGSMHSPVYLGAAKHLGAVRVLHKPFNKLSLLQAVAGAMECVPDPAP